MNTYSKRSSEVTQTVSNARISKGRDAKMFVVYALWELRGIGTTKEIITRLNQIGRSISRPHLIRLSKELEKENIVVRLRVKELAEQLEEIKRTATSQHVIKRVHEIIERHDTKALVLILNLSNTKTKDMIEKARKVIDQLNTKKKILKEVFQSLSLLNTDTEPSHHTK